MFWVQRANEAETMRQVDSLQRMLPGAGAIGLRGEWSSEPNMRCLDPGPIVPVSHKARYFWAGVLALGSREPDWQVASWAASLASDS